MVTHAHSADRQRIASVRAQIEDGNHTVKLQRLPFQRHFWGSSPGGKTFRHRYKLFYHLPEDVVIKVAALPK